MTSTQKAYSAAFLYAAIIGFSFLFVKITLAFASPLDSLAHRFTLSLLAASVPLALNTAVADGRIKRGDLVMIEAMGGGFTWGASLIRW